MADCMFHGQSAPGECPDCKYERRVGKKQGTTPPSDPDYARGMMGNPDQHPSPLVRTPRRNA